MGGFVLAWNGLTTTLLRDFDATDAILDAVAL